MMRKVKLAVIVLVHISFVGGVDTALATPLVANQKAYDPQHRRCHCHLRPAEPKPYLPLAGFENEYGVEKWERALRQSHENWSR
jgi:hypothetical protein